MAEASILPAEVLLSKRVQEMVLKGEEPPPKYVCRDGDAVHEVAAPFSMIPIIDLSLCASSTPGMGQQEELQKLKSALCSWGCFQAVGHGISSTFLDKFRKVSREYFELPMEEKKKQAKGVEDFEGYGADPVPEEGQFLDWSDRLFLEVYPEDQRNPKLWPEKPESFRGILEEYSIKMKKVTDLTSKAMAKSLNIEENCFLTQFGERAQHQARFNYYSRCQRPDLVLGLKPHSDGSGYTIILMDAEGLQVLKDEQWFTVPKISEALLVLMGDQMEIMTNGIFKSPVHRVVTSKEKERISVAVFYSPEVNKEIGPEDRFINEETPRLFKKVKGYPDIHWGYYQKGQRALHVAKV
ncbi:codeine O-demethylase-like [Pistacia vera]|uniref:codeine O-demethylase-like n=1 Tax=Pistacia vera TaxID=55513 RepID=UPI0012636DE7|nr:codeine O-demethylase-like [Pistacia vera]